MIHLDSNIIFLVLSVHLKSEQYNDPSPLTRNKQTRWQPAFIVAT